MNQSPRPFSVLAIGLDGWSLRNAQFFCKQTMAGKFHRSHFSQTYGDAAKQILEEDCPYDCILIHLRLPESFGATKGDGCGFQFYDGLHDSESLLKEALGRNHHVRAIVFVDGADAPSEMRETHFGADLPRVHYAINSGAVNWETLFFHFFTDQHERFNYVPPGGKIPQPVLAGAS